LGIGCLLVIVLIVGVGGYIFTSIKSGKGLSAFIGGVNRPLIEVDESDEKKANDKITSFNETFRDENKAELILSEEEASFMLDRYISTTDDSDLFIFRNSIIDFGPDRATIYADGIIGSEFKVDIKVNTDDGIVPIVDGVYIGRIKAPTFFSDKISLIIEQALEQLKTSNLGSQKITRLRFMQDSVVIEITKI